MKQTYKLNESELRGLIAECVQEVLNEEMDERNIFTNVRDTLGAVKDTFQKGGSFAVHKDKRNMDTSTNDINKLNKKYGITNDASNPAQRANQIASGEVEKLEAEKQQAIANVTAKYDQKIAAAKQKAQGQAAKYGEKRKALGAERSASQRSMAKGMNADPYAGYNNGNFSGAQE